MSSPNCINNIDNIIYCTVEGKFIVGTNSSEAAANAVSPDFDSEFITIPYEVNGNKVEEIGQRAFRTCETIKSVKIEAKITQIGYMAFWGCKNLMSITIPQSCIYILESGVNTLDVSDSSNSNFNGQLNVYFEAPSQLSLIGAWGLANRANVNIFICNFVNSVIDQGAFIQSPNVHVYSPVSFMFGSIETETIQYASYCKIITKCFKPHTINFLIACQIFLFVVS